MSRDTQADPRSAAPTSTPLLDDQPSDIDLLDFGQFVDALDAVILDAQTKTPLIMGVFGRWGTGKSTLMRMLQRRIEGKGVTTVWFNAWLYNKEDEIWAALLQSLTSTLSRRLSFFRKVRFAFGVHDRGLDGASLMYSMPRLIASGLGIAILLLAGYLLSQLFATDAGRALTRVGSLGASFALLYGAVLRPAFQALRDRARSDVTLFRAIDYQSHIGFLDRFREQFARIVASVPSKSGRVVIFIDDLDRCGTDKALEILDTIKVFLDVPGCVFVLGVDIAVIQSALQKKYPDDAVAQGEYLSKIVQLPFHLPPLMDADLRGYVEKLAVRFPDERCREVLLGGLARNPRELKRVINTYALHWYLAQARDNTSDVTPVRLAKVIAIQQGFGRLFEVLRLQPMLLGTLERALRVWMNPPLPGEAPPDWGGFASEDMTMVKTASGLALPPSLTPFADNPGVHRLLTMHPLEEADASFAMLGEEALHVYFNLTHRFAQPATIGVPPSASRPFHPAARPMPMPMPMPMASPVADVTPTVECIWSDLPAPPVVPPVAYAAQPVPQRVPDVWGPADGAPSVPSAATSDPFVPLATARGGPEIDFGPRYAVIGRLGSGGTSEVWLAEDRASKTRVAIKRLLSSLSDDANWSARFERENRLLQSFVHPNITAVLGNGTGRDADGSSFRFIVMEYVAGETLQAQLARETTMPIDRLGPTFLPILDALATIHARGVVHRDIKPSSIYVTTSGVPKLIDFGLAVDHDEGRDQLTSVGTIIGTPAYMSPEQLMGKPFGPASDLFSLGVVLYEAATGTNPMKGDNAVSTMQKIMQSVAPPPSRLNAALSPAFDAFIARMLAKAAENRWPDAGAARTEFAHALDTTRV